MKKLKKTQAAYTIIEILVTIFVIGIGFFAIYSMFILSNSIIIRSHHTNQAYLIANQTIEKLRAQPFSAINNETTTEITSILPSGVITKNISAYNLDTSLKQINITVSWAERGKTISVNIASLATPRGINN